MPRFNAVRNFLRGSKDTTSEIDATFGDAYLPSTIPPTPRPEYGTPSSSRSPSPELAAYLAIPFVSLHRRPGLIFLAEAQRTPEIVYHSVSSLVDPTPEPEPEFPPHNYQMTLIPLAVAAARKDIKYRREGFEMMEAAAHIAAVRADLF